MNKKRVFIQIAISLAIVLVFGIILAITYVSLIKKSKRNFAEESLKTAALEVLLYEGVDYPFYGTLVFYQVNDENDTMRDAVLYVRINQDSASLLASGEIELSYHNYTESALVGYVPYVGYGMTDGWADEALHLTLKNLSVLYYRLAE